MDLDPSFDPMSLEPRQWVLGHRLQRDYLSVTVSPGGVSKSMFSMLSAVSVATGRDLTGERVHTRGRVWIINNEDRRDELYRRLYGICLRHGVDYKSLVDQLYMTSGYMVNKKFAVVDPDTGLVEITRFGKRVIAEIKRLGIVYLILDPFVSMHVCNENDNVEIEQVVNVFKRIAAETRCTIELIHHTRKAGGNSEQHAGDAEAARGASALINAARSASTLSRMSGQTAEDLNIDPQEARRLVRFDDAKANYALPDGVATWYKLESVVLPNGDEVGVHTPFDINGVRAEIAETEAAARDEIHNQYRLDIADAMNGEASRRWPAVRDNLVRIWSVGEEMARVRMNSSLSEDPILIEHGGVRKRVWRARGEGRTSAVTVHLEPVNGGDDE